jgi:hypothetical protein
VPSDTRWAILAIGLWILMAVAMNLALTGAGPAPTLPIDTLSGAFI